MATTIISSSSAGHVDNRTSSNEESVTMTKPTGEAAALELWDMIQSSSSAPKKRDRFAGAQHGRTLHHPKLPQPTIEKGASSSSISDQEATLRKRLSKALLNASPSGTNLLSDLESPTSTLQFPSATAVGGSTTKYADLDDIFQGPSPTSTLHFPSNIYDEEPEQDDVMIIKQDFAYQDEPVVFQQEVSLEEQVKHCQESSHVQVGTEMETHSPQHTFVVCADTQLGMTSSNDEWETELEYSRKAVQLLNSMHPRPAFCCVCGDLVDMQHSFYTDKGWTREECDRIQDQQNRDFKRVWQGVHEDIALVCLCGNHDVGNRPTPASIETFKTSFGDDYFAFWVNGTYNVVLNSNLFGDPTEAQVEYKEQLSWLKERLEYATHHNASQIFVFEHHPWFLYHEDEEESDLPGTAPFPVEWEIDGVFKDYYFHIPKPYRQQALELFKQHSVTACFSGHFHQNLVSKTEWGMDMIITAPLSMLFESSGKPSSEEQNARGVRVVTVDANSQTFCHRFEPL